MKSDIDALMQEQHLDAILVLGNASHNPAMTYLTGGCHVNKAVLLKKQGAEAVLFCNLMEREEAGKSGLKVRTMPVWPMEAFCNQKGLKLLEEAGLTAGRVGVFGHAEISTSLAMIEALKVGNPSLEFVGLLGEIGVFQRAMETKDIGEVERIRRMGKITVDVVRQTADYLTSREVREDETLLKENGAPLTIGDVHSKIRLWVAEHGAELPAGFIFSIGRDAGVPHSIGTAEDLIRLGKPIIFDIYPSEPGGGYFYDFTRTWSLGYASHEAQELYNQVHEVFSRLVNHFTANAPFKTFEVMTCDYFESKGHPTKRSHPPAPLEGYVHSLGHGVGLNIHERPQSALNKPEDHVLKPGVVFTCEPGLYYPDREMGFRLEDTFWMNSHGQAEILVDYPYDFVLKMKKWNKN